MALRLSEHVVRGAIRNSTRNSVSGWLEVLLPRDGGKETEATPPEPQRRQLLLSLTGNLDGPLAGRDFVFEVQQPSAVDPLPGDPKTVQLQQIGAVGANSWRMARVPLIPAREFVEACLRGETPPVARRTALYLEWFSQNGRVVLELVEPIFEFSDDESDPESSAPDARVADSAAQSCSADEESADPDVLSSDAEPFDPGSDGSAENDWNLFPDDLAQQIRRSAQTAKDDVSDEGHTISEDESPGHVSGRRSWDEVLPGIDPETKALYERWDEISDGSRDEPLMSLFDGPLQLPKPDDIRDEPHAWDLLTTLLSAMALRGVAFEMCSHLTATQAYRILVEDLLPEAEVHPELVASGWVEHFSSWECCPVCAAEFDDPYMDDLPAD